MKNNKLAQHISNELWMQKSKIVEVLASYEETPQRDYTGVRFKYSYSDVVRVIEKGTSYEKYPYSLSGVNRVNYTQEEVENLFANGTWIENPQEEQPTIHATKPSEQKGLMQRMYIVEVVNKDLQQDIKLHSGHLELTDERLLAIEERVKALELIVNEMRKDKECPPVEDPTLKRNLQIDTKDDIIISLFNYMNIGNFSKQDHDVIPRFIKGYREWMIEKI